VEEALKEGVQIERILVSDKLAETNSGYEILKKVSNGDIRFFNCLINFLWKYRYSKPQGILAVLSMKNCDIEDVWDEKNFFVILDSVQDPETWHNN